MTFLVYEIVIHISVYYRLLLFYKSDTFELSFL